MCQARINQQQTILELEQLKVDSNQFINTIYKNAETIRLQARASTELYNKLQYINDQNRIAFNSPKDRGVFLNTTMQVERFAIFGLGSLNLQKQEAKELALKALKLPTSLKHLETAEAVDEKTKNTFDANFIGQIHKARFEKKTYSKRKSRRT
ncbi:hypothetical protein G6F46_009997 [Rhizopus delemar]|nr:hypothetical protein G6F36_013633 [Rhizopus arrhizus]KAG1492113.1 hypothetical protein G6F54_009538 [Rhizopus delemar]KAG1506314.1 hypothetical protein G6F53_009778 [Rhizopus delemar]KAG1549049.1 hypothetical protein G6F49_009714 [Rhizopus delemar]KAG1587795.1 hypothetical protein G6F48_005702 [Rhizopus delemar]